ncbi:hypothetical protein PABG_04408 [Paracoccidioides brasiliensis Pb03]|nr:hypothetical protein PABG_04408 [Paracoccidioides brasiliensis Pb03]
MPSVKEEGESDADDFVASPSFKGILNRFIYDSPPKKPLEALGSLKRKLSNDDDECITAVQEIRRITRSVSRASSTRPPPSPSPQRQKSQSQPALPSRRITPKSNRATSPVCNLRDTIPENLILLFIGVNPGIMTGQTGHVYAHPSNLYWKLLHSSGITTRRHPPSDTYRLPELYSVGNTNIVARPTRDASQLSKKEMDEGVPVLERKIREKRPEAVCLVGKGIWEAVWRVKRGRAIRKEEFKYGWQDEGERMGRSPGWKGARVFVATSTSGLAAGMSMAEKEAVWNQLGDWVKKRREEREKEGVAKVAVPAAAAAGENGDGDGSVDG